MRNFIALANSIEYIEQNLFHPVTREEIARASYTSLSALEKLFHYALRLSIKEYVTKRRMTQAAKDLAAGVESVTALAMKYQYNSVEVFSRAFRRVWGVNPSEFTRRWKFTGIFPRIQYDYSERVGLGMARKKVDLSEVYEYLRERRGTYVLCFDMKHLTEINAVSSAAGDLAILEMAARIDQAAEGDMVAFRIGGDEFALVTGLHDRAAAETCAQKVLRHNGEPIVFEGQEFPLSLWCATMQVPQTLRYSDLFTELQQAITDCKE